MIKIIDNEKKYWTIKDFAKNHNLKFKALSNFISKNKARKINYKGLIFKIEQNLSIKTLIYQQIKNKTLFIKNGIYDWELIKLFWENQIKNNDKDYLKFYDYLKKTYEKYPEFNYILACKIYFKKRDIWMCDTETTYKTFFKDNNKKMETQEELFKNLDVEKIKDYYLKNPNEKPFFWAWNCLNFETKEYHLFNYYQAVEYLDTLKKSQMQWYHNLSYDALYVTDALIMEKDYHLFIEKNEHGYIDKKNQPKKSIYIFAKDNKIFRVEIKNSVGKRITFECSYLKTMASVAKLGEILNLPKKDLNYLTIRTKNHIFTDKEKEYIFTDVNIIVTFINMIYEAYKNRFNDTFEFAITIGATAMRELRKLIPDYNRLFIRKPVFDENGKKVHYETILKPNESIFLRKCYNGGWTNYSIKYLGLILKMIVSLDIKSCYPGIWEYYNLPNMEAIYDCKCQNDLSNNSIHLKFYILEIIEPIKIIKGKENLIPRKTEIINEIDGKTHIYISNDYFPFLLEGEIPVSQYMLKIFFILFNPKEEDYKLKKVICFKNSKISGIPEYVKMWKSEKEIPNLKKDNLAYYEFIKLMLNSPSGKFGQLEMTDETYFYLDENKIIDKAVQVDVKNFEELSKFSYLPIIIATTDMGRLKVLSLIEEIGWDNWVLSDTDSCKFKLSEKYYPKNNPKYFNFITNEWEFIYNQKGENNFGFWDMEYVAEIFKACGKKKYIYQENNEIKVVCAGATPNIKKQMTFENFFVGWHTESTDQNKRVKLNGLPVLLPTTFAVSNIFRSKLFILRGYDFLLTKEYIFHLERISKLIKYSIHNQEIIDNKISNDDLNNLSHGIYY